MNLKIFLFHRVHPERDPLWDPIDPKKFEKIVQLLSKKFQLVQLENFILSKSLRSSKPVASIVFDDGYKDFIEYAFPILNKYRAPSSVYVVTESINKNTPPWTYIVDNIFTKSVKPSINIDKKLLPENLQKTNWKSEDQKTKYASAFKYYLKIISDESRKDILQKLFSDNQKQIPQDLMLSWSDLKELSDDGCVIGSHTVSHPLLGRIKDPILIEKELTISGNTIQQHLGSFPATISYPLGSYDDRVKEIAKKCGYKIGLAVNQKAFDLKQGCDMYEISRIELYNQSMLKTRFRINGGMELFNKISGR